MQKYRPRPFCNERGVEKTFTNSDVVPELHGRTVGLVGFGHIGRLVAKKLSGFDVKVVVYDPYTPKEAIKELGAEKVELEELLKNSDFVSVPRPPHIREQGDDRRA